MIKNVLFLILLLMIFSGIQAQQKHFIYIQSENEQPFYVNLNSSIYSSTTSGYLNISQLVQGKYYLVVGFPKNLFPEQKFVVDISDFSPGEGFTLKQKQDKSWCLVNYITNEVLNNDENAEAKKAATSVVTVDSVKQEKSAGEVSVKNNASSTNPSTGGGVAPIAAAAGATVAVVASVNDGKKETKNDVAKESVIFKKFEKGSVQGVDLIYIDKSQTKADTIALFIPAVKADTIQQQVAVPVQQPSCPPANNEDFFKLRMYMAAAATEDGMVSAAEKAFKEKCYSVEQIRNLGVLFLEEENRFKFFKAAKGHVTDEANFGSLQNQFFQSSYIEAFKNLAKTN